jgi:hypothetical protein
MSRAADAAAAAVLSLAREDLAAMELSVKHADHDQSSHGNWASAKGPTKKALGLWGDFAPEEDHGFFGGATTSGEAKRKVMQDIGSDMRDTLSVTEVEDGLRSLSNLMVGDLPETSGDTHERVASYLVQSWALSANSGESSHIQTAVATRFGVPDDRALRGDYPSELEPDAEALLDAFAAAQYARTQAMFAEKGVTHMTVYRGMVHALDGRMYPLSSWSTDKTTAVSFATENADVEFDGGGGFPDESAEDLVYAGGSAGLIQSVSDITDEYPGQHGNARYMAENPRRLEWEIEEPDVDDYESEDDYEAALSDWSDEDPSYRLDAIIHAVVYQQDIPVERIFSTPMTGLGCLSEEECVVLSAVPREVKHMGPGLHPSGTPQAVHGGGIPGVGAAADLGSLTASLIQKALDVLARKPGADNTPKDEYRGARKRWQMDRGQAVRKVWSSMEGTRIRKGDERDQWVIDPDGDHVIVAPDSFSPDSSGRQFFGFEMDGGKITEFNVRGGGGFSVQSDVVQPADFFTRKDEAAPPVIKHDDFTDLVARSMKAAPGREPVTYREVLDGLRGILVARVDAVPSDLGAREAISQLDEGVGVLPEYAMTTWALEYGANITSRGAQAMVRNMETDARFQPWSDGDEWLSAGDPGGQITAKKLVQSIVSTRLAETYTDSEVLSAWGKSGVRSDGERISNRDDVARALVAMWAQTSNNGHVGSLRLQDNAKRLFGLDNAADWHSDSPEADALVDGVWTEALLAQYTATQDWFRERGVTHVTLHRGSAQYEGGALRPLSSWSTDPAIADAFTPSSPAMLNVPSDSAVYPGTPIAVAPPGEDDEFSDMFSPRRKSVIWEQDMPVSRILSTPVTGIGCFSESECVVLSDAPTIPEVKHGSHDQDTHGNWARDLASAIGVPEDLWPDLSETEDSSDGRPRRVAADPDEFVALFSDNLPDPAEIEIDMSSFWRYISGEGHPLQEELVKLAHAVRLSNGNFDSNVDEGALVDIADEIEKVANALDEYESSMADPDMTEDETDDALTDALYVIEDATNMLPYEANYEAGFVSLTLGEDDLYVTLVEFDVDFMDDESIASSDGIASHIKYSAAANIASRLTPEEGEVLADGYMRGAPLLEGDPAYTGAAFAIGAWAQSSNDNHAPSLLAQEAAVDEFGLANVHDWETNPRDANGYEVIADHDAFRAAQRSFLRAQYALTQEKFEEEGITHVTLYRGQKTYSGKDRPMSSWSMNPDTAAGFGGSSFNSGKENIGDSTTPSDRPVIRTMTVPVERILGIPGYGYGCLNEYECVLLSAIPHSERPSDSNQTALDLDGKHLPGQHRQADHGNRGAPRLPDAAAALAEGEVSAHLRRPISASDPGAYWDVDTDEGWLTRNPLHAGWDERERDFIDGAPYGSYSVEEVRLDRLVSEQQSLRQVFAPGHAPAMDTDPPTVIPFERDREQWWAVEDGNHRLGALIAAGERTARVRVQRASEVKHGGPGFHDTGSPQAVHGGGLRLPRPSARSVVPKMHDSVRARYVDSGIPESDWSGKDYGPGPVAALADGLNEGTESHKQAFRDEVEALSSEYRYAWRKLEGVEMVYVLPSQTGASYQTGTKSISLNYEWFGDGSTDYWTRWEAVADLGHNATQTDREDVIRGVLRHEFAHHLDNLMSESGYDTDDLLVRTVSKLVGAEGNRFGSIGAALKNPDAVAAIVEHVSGYGASQRSELFAEAFVAGGYTGAHPALREFKEAVDQEIGGAWFDDGPGAPGMVKRPEGLR